jgi:hypothetical protein
MRGFFWSCKGDLAQVLIKFMVKFWGSENGETSLLKNGYHSILGLKASVLIIIAYTCTSLLTKSRLAMDQHPIQW